MPVVSWPTWHLARLGSTCPRQRRSATPTQPPASRPPTTRHASALTAILENQGLRARNVRGAHAVLLEVALAQLDPPMGKSLRHFDWMRRTRHSTEYPTLEAPQVTAEDVRDAVAFAQDIVDIAGRVIPEMPVF